MYLQYRIKDYIKTIRNSQCKYSINAFFAAGIIFWLVQVIPIKESLWYGNGTMKTVNTNKNLMIVIIIEQ